MRTYAPAWDDRPAPNLDDFTFTTPDDVVRWASVEPSIGWKLWPEVWHLDAAGRVHCAYEGFATDGIRHWAGNPARLLRARRRCLAAPGGCTTDWMIIESRRCHGKRSVVGEADSRAFVAVRSALDAVDVRLVDVMIFDDRHHWWSLRELENPGAAAAWAA